VIGFAQTLTDGAMQTYLALLLVVESARRRGVGRRLLGEALARSEAKRLDVLAERDSAGFYGSFPHHEWLGYRITAGRSPRREFRDLGRSSLWWGGGFGSALGFLRWACCRARVYVFEPLEIRRGHVVEDQLTVF